MNKLSSLTATLNVPWTQATSPRGETASPGPSTRVLVVDDESINREILQRMLVKSGYQVRVAASANEALDFLSRESTDLVLLDLIMPDMNGIECLRRIRETHPIDQLPVIMVTADSDRERVVSAFLAGANDYVTKPVDREVMLARITTHTRLRRAMLALRESEERYALAARGANDGLWDWDLQRNQIYYSPRFKSMLGFEADEIEADLDEWTRRIHREERAAFLKLTDRHSQLNQTHFELELRMIHRDGSYRWMLCRGVYMRDEQGLVTRMAGSLTDITKGKVGDPLTGLPNRLLFLDRLQCAWSRYQRNPRAPFAVVFLDLDNFKLVNDSLGHQAGDQMLTTIARRIENCVRRVDSVSRGTGDPTAARLAGDEFTILLENVDSTDGVEVVVNRLQREISQPILIGAREIVPTASIGWAIADETVANAEDILGRADAAMYRAKSAGRNCSCQHQAGQEGEALIQLDLEKDLRLAVAARQFECELEPIADLASDGLVGYRLQLNWSHGNSTACSNDELLSKVAELGLSESLEPWLVRETCRRAGAHPIAADGTTPRLLIPFAVKQLADERFAQRVLDALREASFPANRLLLQFGPGGAAEIGSAAQDNLQALGRAGVQLGLSGLASGSFSLFHLFSLPLHFIVLESWLVQSVAGNEAHREALRAILDTAQRRQLVTIAGGTFSASARALLQHLGCQWGPANDASRPSSAAQAIPSIGCSLISDPQAPTSAG